MARFLVRGTLVALLLAGAFKAEAQTAANPSLRPANWSARCNNQTPRLCEVFQTIQGTGEPRIQAHLTLRKALLPDQFKLSIELPGGVWLPVGVTAFANGKALRLPLTFKRCMETCLADLTIGKDQLRELRALTGDGHLEFQMQEGSYVDLPFSWQGFGAALQSASL